MSFSFGTPSSAPAVGGLTGGFSFGANKPATPGFGLTATSQPSTGLFGSTPVSSAPSFGTSTPGFGASATPAFGAATATPGFGAATSTPSFGAATSTPGFGATSATPAFGATSAAPAFGATATPSFGTGLGTGLNFGTGTSTSTGTGLSFGAPAATAAATGLNFSFSTPAASSTQPSLGLFGANNTANTGGLFGAPKLGSGLIGAQPTTSAAPSIGLGGVATTASGIGSTSTTGSADGKSEPPKQTKLPNEILTTVDSFKEFVKKQKSLSSDIMRISVKPLNKVSSELESLHGASLSAGVECGRGRAGARRLRAAAADALAAADVVARGPPCADFEGSLPPSYIKELICELEQQLITFRRQMDVTDKQMQASPKLLSEQELTLGIRRMHESLVALAGRLQAVHSQVEAQKEQYLNLRKYVLKDPTNVFENESSTTSLDQILQDVEGARKKSKVTFNDSLGTYVLTDPRAALGNIHHLAGPTPFNYVGTGLTPFTSAETAGSSWQPQPPTLNPSLTTSGFPSLVVGEPSGAFQLQKPPGKRTKQ